MIARSDRRQRDSSGKPPDISPLASAVGIDSAPSHTRAQWLAADSPVPRYEGLPQKLEQLVAQYEYNELGQMVDKKLHNTIGTNFLQSVDFRYTINGQLQSINNAQLDINTATNDESNDYFGMEMLYNTAESGLGNTAYYNGNIYDL